MQEILWGWVKNVDLLAFQHETLDFPALTYRNFPEEANLAFDGRGSPANGLFELRPKTLEVTWGLLVLLAVLDLPFTVDHFSGLLLSTFLLDIELLYVSCRFLSRSGPFLNVFAHVLGCNPVKTCKTLPVSRCLLKVSLKKLSFSARKPETFDRLWELLPMRNQARKPAMLIWVLGSFLVIKPNVQTQDLVKREGAVSQ